MSVEVVDKKALDLARRRERYRANPSLYNKRTAASQQKKPEYYRAKQIKRLYNLDWDNYVQMFECQNASCAICRTPIALYSSPSETRTSAVVDHCHISGEVRGLLCGSCNGGLGLFKDNTLALKLAIEYLEKGRK